MSWDWFREWNSKNSISPLLPFSKKNENLFLQNEDSNLHLFDEIRFTLLKLVIFYAVDSKMFGPSIKRRCFRLSSCFRFFRRFSCWVWRFEFSQDLRSQVLRFERNQKQTIFRFFSIYFLIFFRSRNLITVIVKQSQYSCVSI